MGSARIRKGSARTRKGSCEWSFPSIFTLAQSTRTVVALRLHEREAAHEQLALLEQRQRLRLLQLPLLRRAVVPALPLRRLLHRLCQLCRSAHPVQPQHGIGDVERVPASSVRALTEFDVYVIRRGVQHV